ncbi:Phosphatidate phosphatase APP1 [Catalinimonas alkaloidigena]|uniref:Phosphatidate phosphatase APP1 n=1 Tax=Catalinimonas alkaloidigena TaxID=1075417 RepID=A0A1G9IJ12_9BACT|nr:phosphatase domain-containing protein [Catalinimonas alkaloidigena]SDL25046.1 Phosphatidate phosphatase APP1 [Catalinimonas alkaloidigena]
MSELKRIFQRIASNADDFIDELRDRFTEHTGGYGPVQLVTYRGLGNKEEIYLKGRVLLDRNVKPAGETDSVWRNLMAMYKRFNTREIPNVRVRARFAGQEQTVRTNAEGYFEVRFALQLQLPDWRDWYEVELELLDQVAEGQETVRATGHVQVAHAESVFGVISDLDDTVLETGATNLLKMARLTFLNNARTRLPFAGVAAFYRALQRGPQGKGFHPIYYVSSSPWNLYDLLVEFCQVHGIPDGPLMLRDIGIDQEMTGGHHTHKLAQIEHIMRYTDPLPYILIGDSGQQDPEIYERVVEEYPGRVKAIYIRDVSEDARDSEVFRIAQRVRDQGVEFVFVRDTLDAAHHALQHGYLYAGALEDIGLDAKLDKEAPSDLEQIMGLEGK